MTYKVNRFWLKLSWGLVGFELSKESKNLSKVEVYLNDDQIKNLKGILDQSQLGVHLLFDNKKIADVFQKAFSEDDFFQAENLKRIQDDLLKLLQFKSLTDKQDFVRQLSPEDQERLIRAYFYIIENNMRSNKKHTSH